MPVRSRVEEHRTIRFSELLGVVASPWDKLRMNGDRYEFLGMFQGCETQLVREWKHHEEFRINI